LGGVCFSGGALSFFSASLLPSGEAVAFFVAIVFFEFDAVVFFRESTGLSGLGTGLSADAAMGLLSPKLVTVGVPLPITVICAGRVTRIVAVK